MNISETTNEGVRKNKGCVEQFEFLKESRLLALTVEHIAVACACDENLSTSFQMRHVVDPEGNRGFMRFVSKELLRINSYRQGTTRAVYDEVMVMGEAFQKEKLRKSWLNLNRR